MLQTGSLCHLTISVLLLLASVVELLAQTASPKARYTPYDDARPILEALSEILPAELKNPASNDPALAWPAWEARRDAEIRARLIQGDEDSLANFLLFGMSYTKQPRISLKQLAQLRDLDLKGGQEELAALNRVLNARVDDLIRGIVAPRGNERLLFARQVVEKQEGFNPSAAADRAKLKEYFLGSLDRMLKEQASYSKIIEQARLGSATEEFAERSRLYRTRGLSLDTSLLPNFAIEESLAAIRGKKLLDAGSVWRVAIIGPGLDFTDKQEGYDFYPQQTIQPFAVVDSLLRLGLAQRDSLQVVTFDLSPRINQHLTHARESAQRKLGYTVQLPRDPGAGWKTEAINYWGHFGDQIAVPVRPVAVPLETGDLKIRAVRIRPEIVSRITPVDLNIVLQRLNLPAPERFDLIIATNIFVYYDVFEQTLALKNVEQMLRPGGFLLSNNALAEFPFLNVHSVGYLTVVYSDRPNDGDHVAWYQRSPN